MLDPGTCCTVACLLAKVYLCPRQTSYNLTFFVLCVQGLRLSLARMRLAKDKAEATVSELESNVQMHRAAAAALKQVSASAKRTLMLLSASVRSSAAIPFEASLGQHCRQAYDRAHIQQHKCHRCLCPPCRQACPDMHTSACRLPALSQQPASCKPSLLRRSTPLASCAQRWTCSRRNTAK